MDLNKLAGEIIGAAIEVHRELGGPGLLEEVYESAMAWELGLRGVAVKRQVPVPVIYKGQEVKKPLFLDLLVADRVIVEVKAVENFNLLFKSQLLTYLRLTGKNLGLIINFGEKFVKDGIHRVVNGLPE